MLVYISFFVSLFFSAVNLPEEGAENQQQNLGEVNESSITEELDEMVSLYLGEIPAKPLKQFDFHSRNVHFATDEESIYLVIELFISGHLYSFLEKKKMVE